MPFISDENLQEYGALKEALAAGSIRFVTQDVVQSGELHALLHRLWSKAVEINQRLINAGMMTEESWKVYDKQEWVQLEELILKLQGQAGGGTVTRRSDEAKAVGSTPTQPTDKKQYEAKFERFENPPLTEEVIAYFKERLGLYVRKITCSNCTNLPRSIYCKQCKGSRFISVMVPQED